MSPRHYIAPAASPASATSARNIPRPLLLIRSKAGAFGALIGPQQIMGRSCGSHLGDGSAENRGHLKDICILRKAAGLHW